MTNNPVIDLSGGISNPLIQAASVVGIGIAMLIVRRWRSAAALILAAATWAYVCSTPAFAFMLWHGLANQYPPHPPASHPRADAIVLVGGGPVPQPLDRWNARVDAQLSTPLGFAVALYRAGKAPVLVAIANYAMPGAATAITRQGVPHAAQLLEPDSVTTHQDSIYARDALRKSRGETILLVATGMHMPRTAATFRNQKFHVIAAPTMRPAWVANWQHNWRPAGRALYLSTSCLHEYIGLAYYRVRGWASW